MGLITTKTPKKWSSLQAMVGEVLRECGFTVETEKRVRTVRGEVSIDVYAEESVNGRRYVVLCECKLWNKRVPQSVIHAFRTVVADSGGNLGYIISARGFQSGALSAAELSNIRLVTWEEFQIEFVETWFEKRLLPFVTEHFDSLMTYTEPLAPRAVSTLGREDQKRFFALREKYAPFGMLLMVMFTTYARAFRESALPPLPLRGRLGEGRAERGIPRAVLDAVGYRDLLDAAMAYGDVATAKFRDVCKTDD